MVATLKANKSLFQTIEYNLKDLSVLIKAGNLEGDCIEDYYVQMKATQMCFSGRANNLTLHCFLSPHPEDGIKLTKKDWIEIGERYLKELGLSKHQFLIFLHSDRSSGGIHAHLVINRLCDKSYKVWYSRENDLSLSYRIGHLISKERGLTKSLQKERAISGERPQGVKQLLYEEMIGIRFNGVANYFNSLKLAGFKVRQFHDKKTGDLKGYGVQKYGTFMSASKIGYSLTLEYLRHFEIFLLSINQIKAEVDYRKEFNEERERIRKKFALELRMIPFEESTKYFNRLEEAGFVVKVFKNKGNGATQGYGVEKNGVYFKSSDISKEFTLRSLSGVKQNLDKVQGVMEKTPSLVKSLKGVKSI